MGLPTTGTPIVGARSKLWIATTLPFNASTALCLEFTGEGPVAVGQNYHNAGIRGTRSRGREGERRVGVAVSGTINLTPRYTELRTLLPLILGGSEAGAGSAGDPYTYALAETLPTFYLLVQRVPSEISSHTKAVFLYEGCTVSRATFSASQAGPLSLALDIEASTEKAYQHGSVSTAFDGSTAVISSGTAVPTSSPGTEQCWIFSDTQGSAANMKLGAADREAFDWSLTLDNVLDTTRQMNSLYRRSMPAQDRDLQMAATVPFSTAEMDLFWPDVNDGSPDMNDNEVRFVADAAMSAITLRFLLGTWNPVPVTPSVSAKNEVVLPLAGPVYRKNSSTAKPELAVSMWTP